jgi:hypothetical protein
MYSNGTASRLKWIAVSPAGTACRSIASIASRAASSDA